MSCLRATQMRAVAMLLRLAAAVALLAPARAACLWNPHCMYCRARQMGSRVLDYLPSNEFKGLPQALLNAQENVTLTSAREMCRAYCSDFDARVPTVDLSHG